MFRQPEKKTRSTASDGGRPLHSSDVEDLITPSTYLNFQCGLQKELGRTEIKESDLPEGERIVPLEGSTDVFRVVNTIQFCIRRNKLCNVGTDESAVIKRGESPESNFPAIEQRSICLLPA